MAMQSNSQSTPVNGLTRDGDFFRYAFNAMATPCDLKIETTDAALANRAGQMVEAEAVRIEHKFSRYRADSVVSKINANAGTSMAVDDETAQLIDFAVISYDLSAGLFDITSGILRRAWTFDGGTRVPSAHDIAKVLAFVGWDKVEWNRPTLRLMPGMELDFGGIGKEYAVDRAIALLGELTDAPVLVNFGGDLRVSGPSRSGGAWRIALESTDAPGSAAGTFDLFSGALATSGDARRFVVSGGKRYGHILNPQTGMPVDDPPRSVTVAAPTCVEAGMIATLAILNGAQAEAFLRAEQVRAWCIR